MNKILYCTMFCCLLTSAMSAQEQTKVVTGQIKAKSSQSVPAVVKDQFRPAVANPHQAVVVGSANVQFAGNCSSCHTGTTFTDGGSTLLDYVSIGSHHMTSGVALLEPDSVTRKMLKLDEGKGIVVHGVCPSTKRLNSLLEAHDVILNVNDEPANSIQKVDQALKAPTQLKMVVLRGGVEKEIVEPVSEGQTSATKQRRYLIGVVLGELSSVVKSQLKLAEDVNVFISDFSDNSAAKTAGLQENDILLKVNDSPIVNSEMLQKAVQNSKGEELTLDVLRDGNQLEVSVTPTLIETSFVAVVEGQEIPTVVGRYLPVDPRLPNVMPMVAASHPPNVVPPIVPHETIQWFPSFTPAIIRQRQSIDKQLQQMEKQLERRAAVLEKLSDEK